MTYAIPDDIADALGRAIDSVTDSESRQWQHWLDRVERSIARAFRRRGQDLATAVASGDPSADDVADVEVAAAIRKIQNPNWGETSYTQSIDDGSITRRREGAQVGVDPLDLLDDEWTALFPTIEAGAFSVRPTFEPDCGPFGAWT